jgi:UDP-glucose 4-epimerase
MSGAGRTVLVTGAAGFIGSALCARLLAAGDRVVGFDDLSRGRRDRVPAGVPIVRGDVRDAAAVSAALADRRPDVVVHLAAMHFIPDCIARPRDTMEVNVEGTSRVLEACRATGVAHVVFASTAAVYAPGDAPCDEDATPLGPLEIYGESKLRAEEAVAAFHRETGTPATILRLFNAIGRNETNPHVVPHIFESLQTSNVIHLGNTAPRRDYVDTRDVADAVVAAAGTPAGLAVYNVGTGRAHSVDDIVAALRRMLGRDITVVRDPSRVRRTDRMVLAANIDRIRRATSWTPRFLLEDTLRDLVEAYGLRAEHSPAR